MDFNSGGKKAIERLVEAYGFGTRQALCDHLGVSKSTMATRYMRDIFPADWVIQCALETGTSLNWLTTGHGSKQASANTNTIEVEKYLLSDGALQKDGFYIFDKGFLPSTFKKPFVITDNNSEFICDKEFDDIRDGKWVFCCLKFKLFKIMMLEALFFNDGDKMAAASKRERHLS